MTQGRGGTGWGVAVLVSALAGCVLPGEGPRVPPPTAPLFTVEPGDAAFFQDAARDQDARLADCAAQRTCGDAHFLRGLVALAESRQTAAAHFKQALVASPTGELGDASRAWLAVLQDGATGAAWRATGPAVKRLVKEVLEGNRAIRQLSHELASTKATADSQETELRHSRAQLKEREAELHERDQKVAELTEQLEALKRIDREMKEKARARKSFKPAKPSPKKDHTP